MKGLSVSGLAVIRGERQLFRGLRFALAPGEAMLLHGPNGSGKSSLLRLLAGFLLPAAGSIHWDGADALAEPDSLRAAALYLGHQDAVKPQLPAEENLLFQARIGGDAGDAVKRVGAALAAVGLERQRRLPGRYLSAGQKRRLALARLLLSDSRLWLLDEPTNALDAAAIQWLGQALARHRAAGGSVLLASHVPVPLIAPRILHLPDGRLA